MLEERIQILETGDVIGKEAADFTRELISMLRVRYPDIPDEKAEMFITHLAMAAQREIDHIPEAAFSESLLEGVRAHPAYPKACDLLEEVRKLAPVEFSDTEADFLVVHMCNLFSV